MLPYHTGHIQPILHGDFNQLAFKQNRSTTEHKYVYGLNLIFFSTFSQNLECVLLGDSISEAA